MTANKVLFILKNNGEQPNLFIKTIFSIFAQKDIDPYCVIFFNLENHSEHNNIHQKLLFLLENYFIDYINNKKLFIINTSALSDHIELVKEYKLINFNFYAPISGNNIYLPLYAKNAIDYLINQSIDYINVKPIYEIDINNNFIQNSKIKQIFLTKKSLIESITNNIFYTNNHLITYNTRSTQDNKYSIFTKDFNLVWIEETPDSYLESSYIFIYKKYNKVFNISNNTHGIVNQITDKELIINWFLNNSYKEYVYELADNQIFTNIKYESK
jgi:hypothetical protein